jgi:hypothetical protein
MTCISGPPCRPGKTGRIDLLGDVLVIGQDHAAARAAQGLVGGRVVATWACGNGLGWCAAGDETGEMGHVDQQDGADASAMARNRAKSIWRE